MPSSRSLCIWLAAALPLLAQNITDVGAGADVRDVLGQQRQSGSQPDTKRPRGRHYGYVTIVTRRLRFVARSRRPLYWSLIIFSSFRTRPFSSSLASWIWLVS